MFLLFCTTRSTQELSGTLQHVIKLSFEACCNNEYAIYKKRSLFFFFYGNQGEQERGSRKKPETILFFFLHQLSLRPFWFLVACSPPQFECMADFASKKKGRKAPSVFTRSSALAHAHESAVSKETRPGLESMVTTLPPPTRPITLGKKKREVFIAKEDCMERKRAMHRLVLAHMGIGKLGAKNTKNLRAISRSLS